MGERAALGSSRVGLAESSWRESGQPFLLPCCTNILYSAGRCQVFLYDQGVSRDANFLMDEHVLTIQRALEQGPFSLRGLAEDAGISYDSLYSWARGRRTPKPENLRQVADEFERRADRLRELAKELRNAAMCWGE